MLCSQIFNGVLIQSVPYGRHWPSGMLGGLRAEDLKACEEEVESLLLKTVKIPGVLTCSLVSGERDRLPVCRK